jgi:Hydrogenase/urease nickel incorporation, metallochaperone, hypA
MHELAITESVVEAVAERVGDARVTRVVLEIGMLSGVLPDALRFCFDLCTEARFTENLRLEAPPLAVIEHMHEEVVAPTGDGDFAIIDSRSEGDRRDPISPDIATCADCVRDIFDPANRRYRFAKLANFSAMRGGNAPTF